MAANSLMGPESDCSSPSIAPTGISLRTTEGSSAQYPGAQGIQVRGSAKGMGNSHPVCIRGFMQNRLNGDGDAVAIWGRCQKEDPADGINNSDTCAIHSAVYNESKGSGLIMASEHWAIVGENGGTEQTNGTPAGATICQHVKAFSSKGMAHAGILISGGMDNYPYGMWNAIQISRGAFMRNGSMDGIPRIASIVSATLMPRAKVTGRQSAGTAKVCGLQWSRANGQNSLPRSPSRV